MSRLGGGVGGITPARAAAFAEAAAVMLEDQGHHPGVTLKVGGDLKTECEIHWLPVTAQMVASNADIQEATEEGACAIAFLVVVAHTDYTIVRRSFKGTGFDYWLGRSWNPDRPFQDDMARLEVSGIRNGNDDDIVRRVRAKLNQTKRSDGGFPAYIIVIEFRGPVCHVSIKGAT